MAARGTGRPERIHTLGHHRDRMVDDGALKLGERRKALVEISLRQSGGQADTTHAERARALGSGDREGGSHQAVPSVDAPVVGADPLERHRHLVFHLGCSIVDTVEYQSLRSLAAKRCPRKEVRCRALDARRRSL